MPQTLGGPDYYKNVNYEQSDFYSSSVRMDGQTVVMHAIIAYADMLDFEATMKGFTATNGAAIRRFPPQPHYQRKKLYCSQIDFVRNLSAPTQDPFGNLRYTNLLPDGKSYGDAGYGRVEMACTFEPAPDGMLFLPDSQRPGIRPDELWRACGRRRETEVTSQQLPPQALFFSNSADSVPMRGKSIPAVGAVVLATHTLYYTTIFPLAAQGSDKLFGDLETNLADCVGAINNSVFDGIYPPFTLLALAPRRELIMQADETFAAKMTYIFAVRGTKDLSGSDLDSDSPNWVRILNGNLDPAKAYTVVNRGTPGTPIPGNYAYKTRDLQKLFTP